MAGNRKLTTIYRKLIKEISLFRRINLDDANQLPASAHAHWKMLRAIASGEPELAGRAMFEHVIQSKNRMVENEARRRTNPAPVPD